MKYFFWIAIGLAACAAVYFFFAPAFAGKISIPAEIDLGSFGIRIYGITMALAILTGYLVMRKFSWRFGINSTEVDDIAFWITVIGILGARIYYVLFNWHLYSGNLAETYKIWHGGISVYGGIIAGIIFILLYVRRKAYSAYNLLDLVAVAAPLAQAVGRFGNFFNQEAYGLPTSLPWKMYVDVVNRPIEYRQYNFFHPAFLYEALADVVIFFILTKLLMGKIKPGVLMFSYLGFYSVARFFIESVRLDSSYIHGIKVDQVTAIIGLTIAGIMILRLQKKTV